MGQKSNPNSLRLNKLHKQKSLWYADTTYTQILHDGFIIRKTLINLLEKKYFWVNDIIIKRTHNSIYVYIYFFSAKKKKTIFSFKKLTKIKYALKQYLNIHDQKINLYAYNYNNFLNIDNKDVFKRLCRRYKPYPWLRYQKDFYRLAIVSIYTQNATAFCNFVAQRFARTTQQKQIITFLVRIFSILKKRMSKLLIGCRFQIKGRLQGRLRGKTFSLQRGNLPLNTFSVNMVYAFSNVFTKFGTYGFKIWLCFSTFPLKYKQTFSLNKKKTNIKFFFLIKQKNKTDKQLQIQRIKKFEKYTKRFYIMNSEFFQFKKTKKIIKKNINIRKIKKQKKIKYNTRNKRKKFKKRMNKKTAQFFKKVKQSKKQMNKKKILNYLYLKPVNPKLVKKRKLNNFIHGKTKIDLKKIKIIKRKKKLALKLIKLKKQIKKNIKKFKNKKKYLFFLFKKKHSTYYLIKHRYKKLDFIIWNILDNYLIKYKNLVSISILKKLVLYLYIKYLTQSEIKKGFYNGLFKI